MTYFPLLMNHLWQSTVVAVLVWVITAVLRQKSAAVRYQLWFLASVKFLVPLSFLIAAGENLRARVPCLPPQPSRVTAALGQTVQPYAPPTVRTAAAGDPAASARLHPFALPYALWALGTALFLTSWARRWLTLRQIAREAMLQGFVQGVPILQTAGLLEPGVFGIFRPVLLLPATLSAHLSPSERDMIFAHELCHVRRRDNLTAAIHAFVQALFWFHPMLWLIRARLLEEREHACDEAVLSAGKDPEAYARSILEICRLYLNAPAEAAAGVSGGQLRVRISRIVSGLSRQQLGTRMKLGLAMLALFVLAVPLTAGLLDARRVEAQSQDVPPMAAEADPSFEVATIKPSDPKDGNTGFMTEGRQVTVENQTLAQMLVYVYGIQKSQVDGAPAWFDTDRYDIRGIANAPGQPSQDQLKVMVRKLLGDRLHFKTHDRMRELPVYALRIAKGGPKLKPAAARPEEGTGSIGMPGKLSDWRFNGQTMLDFAQFLQFVMDRPVVDQTGLTDKYDFRLQWASDQVLERDPAAGPGIFTAMPEQIGLKLEATRAPARVMVVDHVDRPSAN